MLLDGGGCDTGLSEHALPVVGDEGAAERDGAVVRDVAVPAEEERDEAEESGGAAAAVEIVDEPAEAGVDFHPAKVADDFGGAEVVGEERAEDDVGLLCGGVGEDVGGEELNVGSAGVFAAEFESGAGGVRVEVDAGELDGEVAFGGPVSDGAEGVAAAGADVKDAEGVRRSKYRGLSAPASGLRSR